MGDRWLVALNPHSGRRPIDVNRLHRALAAVDVEYDLEVADSTDEMRRVVLTGADYRRLAVVGGDGTVNLAVNVLMDLPLSERPVLGVLPSGTGCDLLRTFGIPQTPEGAAQHLAGNSAYALDIGEVSGTWGLTRFANVGQAGVGAVAARTAARLPRFLGKARYMTAFVPSLVAFSPCDVELVTERRTHQGRALAVVFANGQFFAGGWNVAPKAMLVDGELDLQVFDLPKTSAPAMVPRVMRGLHLTDRRIRRLSAAEFRLETNDPWPVEVDGDVVGNTPVEGRVLPAALQLKI